MTNFGIKFPNLGKQLGDYPTKRGQYASILKPQASDPVSGKNLRIRVSDIRSYKSEFVGFKGYKDTQVLTTYYNSLSPNFKEPSQT